MRIVLIAAATVLLLSTPALALETYVAHLSDAKTGTGSPAEGTATLVLSDDATLVSYHVDFQYLQGALTGCHIHRKGAGIAYDLGLVIPAIGVWNPDAADVDRLRNGELYVNVHSDFFPAGEIQGTLFQSEVGVENTTWGRVKALYRQ